MEKKFMQFEFFMSDLVDDDTRKARTDRPGYGPVSIDLNRIVGMEPPKLFKASYQEERKKEVILACVYMDWHIGRGINGVSTIFYISPKDYKKVCSILNTK